MRQAYYNKDRVQSPKKLMNMLHTYICINYVQKSRSGLKKILFMFEYLKSQNKHTDRDLKF